MREGKCEHGYKDGEYCLMCDKPEYIKLLEFEHKSLEAENKELKEENKNLRKFLSCTKAQLQEHTDNAEIAKLKAKLEGAEKLYHELLWAVCARTPGETRHETALRYIKEKESGGSNTLSTLREKG